MSTKLPPKKSLDQLQVDCEVAAEILAECMAYFAKQLATEKKLPQPNLDKVEALESKLDEIKRHQLSLSPQNPKLINDALYIWAPLLRKEHG